MSSEFFAPDYFPPSAIRWAMENEEVLRILVEETLSTGHAPEIGALTRRLARKGHPLPLRELLWSLPRALGQIDNQTNTPRLFFPAFRLVPTGAPILEGFNDVLQLAISRYQADDDRPIIRHHETIPQGEPALRRVLAEILLREAPFLSDGAGSTPEDSWSREVNDNIVRYWKVRSADDYLRTRARELASSPTSGWSEVVLVEQQPAARGEDLTQSRKANATTSDQAGQRDAFISHAGEDSDVAMSLATLLSEAGWKVWLDRLEITLGDSLHSSLNEALTQSDFGVVLLSEAFFTKPWAKKELNALAAKEAISGTKVILPIWHGIDEHYLATEAPLLADRVGVKTSDGVEHVAAEIDKALNRARRTPFDSRRTAPIVQSVEPPPITKTPRTEVELERLNDERPAYWEYLLFAGRLYLGKQALEPLWTDHELRLGSGMRRHLDEGQAADFASQGFSDLLRHISRATTIFTPEVQERAFGPRGESGDWNRIERLATLIVEGYAGLMEIAASFRNQSVPDDWTPVFELQAQATDLPIQQFRDFIDHAVEQMDALYALSAETEASAATDADPIVLSLELIVTADEDVMSRLLQGFKTIRASRS